MQRNEQNKHAKIINELYTAILDLVLQNKIDPTQTTNNGLFTFSPNEVPTNSTYQIKYFHNLIFSLKNTEDTNKQKRIMDLLQDKFNDIAKQPEKTDNTLIDAVAIFLAKIYQDDYNKIISNITPITYITLPDDGELKKADELYQQKNIKNAQEIYQQYFKTSQQTIKNITIARDQASKQLDIDLFFKKINLSTHPTLKLFFQEIYNGAIDVYNNLITLVNKNITQAKEQKNKAIKTITDKLDTDFDKNIAPLLKKLSGTDVDKKLCIVKSIRWYKIEDINITISRLNNAINSGIKVLDDLSKEPINDDIKKLKEKYSQSTITTLEKIVDTYADQFISIKTNIKKLKDNYIEQLDDYVKFRNNKYSFKDLFTSSDKIKREAYIAKLKIQLNSNEANKAELIKLIDEGIDTFPSGALSDKVINLQNILTKLRNDLNPLPLDALKSARPEQKPTPNATPENRPTP